MARRHYDTIPLPSTRTAGGMARRHYDTIPLPSTRTAGGARKTHDLFVWTRRDTGTDLIDLRRRLPTVAELEHALRWLKRYEHDRRRGR
jgi:hypothetical protein